MTLFEYLERVKDAFPDKHRTRIVLDLNQRILDFCRETRALTTSVDLFTRQLVDTYGNVLVTEQEEELVVSQYGSEFPLPADCYVVLSIEDSSEEHTYTLKHGVLRFYSGNTLAVFDDTTTVTITLHYEKRPALLSEDADEPELLADFHEGPLYTLLAHYAALARDKDMLSYYLAQAELKKQEARAYATTLRRRSYDVKPLDWRN